MRIDALLLSVVLAASPAGLWKSKKFFGPEVRGPVVIQKSGETYTADLAGAVVPVRVERGAVSFALPNGKGSFRGKLDRDIRGHWYPPGSVPRLFVYASPVELKADGPNRWRGEIVPFDDTFTFYLMLREQPDGSFSALLRNPDRDEGGMRGAERLTLDGSAVKLTGKGRDVATGTYDAERDVLTLNFPSRGGSYDFRRDDAESGFYPRGAKPARYVYRPPLARDDGWPVGTLEEADLDRAAIEKFIQWIVDTPSEAYTAPVIEGVLIARHGKLVLEEYFYGRHRDELHETRSAAKSLTATVIGAAMHAGAPLSLSSPVYQVMHGGAFPPDLEPRKRAMTLEHLLTMSAGYFCDDTNPDAPGNENFMIDEAEEPDTYRFTLAVPMATAPGEKSVYCSSQPNLALGMLNRATGEPVLETFDRLVARPMKIRHYGWWLERAGHPYGGGGVQLYPRDFMKLGQLMLNGGTWEGRRILSRDFVTRASSPLYDLRELKYGYLWWVRDYPYRDRTVRVYYAAGAGGQSTIVVPELDLVIATYGASYSSGKATHAISRDLARDHILAAVR
ncbi:MAG TPA: serine hydrolase [Thermoanaerobaculia bacterium]|nr:serine hydrolase [Thermoanaerobaculia bacterium]